MSDRDPELVDALVRHSDVAVPQRACVIIAGLHHDGEPIHEERWFNFDDPRQPIGAYTKCGDIAFIQQGLAIEQMKQNLDGDDDD